MLTLDSLVDTYKEDRNHCSHHCDPRIAHSSYFSTWSELLVWTNEDIGSLLVVEIKSVQS
jgi:hypothetical protein